MSFPHLENFDGVASGTDPAGWTFASGLTTTNSPPDGVAAQSPPNVMESETTVALTSFYATYQTADTVGGDVVVGGKFNACGVAKASFQLLARGSSSALGPSTTQYAIVLSVNSHGPQLALESVVAGVSTSIQAVSIAGGTPGTDWYQVVGTFNGSSISVTVQDLATGEWLTSSGAWQSAAAAAISAADSTIVGPGYAGFVLSNQGGPVVIDDWDFGSAVSSSGPGSLSATEGRDAGSFAGAFGSAGSIAGGGSGDAASLSGSVETAILTRQEAADVAAGAGDFASGGGIGSVEGRDAGTFHGFLHAGALGAVEGGDAGAIAGDSVAAATGRAVEGGDASSIVASVHNDITLAAIEARDAAALAGSLATSGRLPAIEGRDVGVVVAGAAITAALAAAEAGDRGVIPSVALGVPPSFRVREAGDIPAVLGSSPALHYNVYVSPAPGEAIDYSAPVGVTAALAWTSGTLAAPGVWCFGVRATSGGGEEQNLDCSVLIRLNAAGVDVSDIPPPPVGLRAFSTVGADVVVNWGYPPAPGPKAPTGFHVYLGTSGAPEYATPAATVAFSAAVLGTFATTLTGLVDGTTYSIGVRAFNASGEEGNTSAVSVTADGTGPAAVDSLAATAIV